MRAPLSVFCFRDKIVCEEMTMKKNKVRNADAGMSLLEVIVAVSIFSIAAMVLLQSFVTSQRINKKSNLYLEATTVAQNIMEEIKAKDFEDVALAFNYPQDILTGECRLTFLSGQLGNGELGISEVLKNATDGTYSPVRLYHEGDGEDTSRVTASVISKDDGITYEFQPRKTGENESKYYFQLTNVTNHYENFDALVEFDGGKSSGYKKKTVTNDEEGKNDYLVPNIAKLDTKTNAFLIMEKNWDANAMSAIAEAQLQAAQKLWHEDMGDYIKNASTEEEKTALAEQFTLLHPEPLSALDVDDIYKQTKRTLFIKVEEGSGRINAKAKYVLNTYGYEKMGGNKYQHMDICPCAGKSEQTKVEGCFCTYESAYWTFYSSEADAELKNLYVFYYPNYDSTNSTKPLDSIVVENTDNYAVDLYITKQRDEAQNIPSSVQENGYRMSLTVKECPAALGQSNWNTNPSLYRAQMKLRTNLDYNISDLDKILSRPKISQMQLTYQSVNLSGVEDKKKTGTAAKQILSYNGLDDKAAQDRIYIAKVSVYKAGAAAKGFPEEDLVASLDGAKEN